MTNIAFIGTGIMGKPMAANLIKGGHTLYVTSRSGVPQELTAAGATSCGGPKEVAQKALDRHNQGTQRLVKRLRDAGYPVTGYNRTKAKAERLIGILRDPLRFAFHLVALAEPVPEAQTRYLFNQLKERGVDCVVVMGTNLFYLTNGLAGERFGWSRRCISSKLPSATSLPASTMPTWVQISATSARMWVEKKMVLPSRLSSSSSSRISMRARGSRPEAGSSRMRI